MTIRNYFDKHPNFLADGGPIVPIKGVDDALLYSGVPIDETVFQMIRAGNFDVEIPEHSLRRLREIGGFCG